MRPRAPPTQATERDVPGARADVKLGRDQRPNLFGTGMRPPNRHAELLCRDERRIDREAENVVSQATERAAARTDPTFRPTGTRRHRVRRCVVAARVY